jgi:hypothetical protein
MLATSCNGEFPGPRLIPQPGNVVEKIKVELLDASGGKHRRLTSLRRSRRRAKRSKSGGERQFDLQAQRRQNEKASV